MDTYKVPFYAPCFFAQKMGTLTNQMAAYAEEYARRVAPDVDETFINALYLPSEGYRLVDWIFTRQFEALSGVPEIANKILSDFPGFLGDAADLASRLVTDFPTYASNAATLMGNIFNNYPVIASRIVKIVAEGGRYYFEFLDGLGDVIIGTLADLDVNDILSGADKYWNFITSSPFAPWNSPIFSPIKKAISGVPSVTITDENGNDQEIPWDTIGAIPSFNPAIWGGLGGALPVPSGVSEDWRARVICYFAGVITASRITQTTAEGNFLVLAETKTPNGCVLGGVGQYYSGYAGNIVGRDVINGTLISSPIPAVEVSDFSFRHFGSGSPQGQIENGWGFGEVYSWNTVSGRLSVGKGSYAGGGFLSPYDVIAVPQSQSNEYEQSEPYYTYPGQVNTWKFARAQAMYCRVMTMPAASLLGLPPFIPEIRRIGGVPPFLPAFPFAPGFPGSPFVLGSTMLQTMNMIANLLINLRGAGRKDERHERH